MVSVEGGGHHGYCGAWAPWLVWRVVGTMVSVEGGHHG